MKFLPLAVALALAPVAAQAQVAAGTMPNTFDSPNARMQATAPAVASQPASPASEDALRAVIASAQAGSLDYALMSDDLAGKVREQEAAVVPLIQGFGALVAVDFVRSQDRNDLFSVTFAEAATEWVIGIDDAGKIAALLFRPAE